MSILHYGYSKLGSIPDLVNKPFHYSTILTLGLEYTYIPWLVRPTKGVRIEIHQMVAASYLINI